MNRKKYRQLYSELRYQRRFWDSRSCADYYSFFEAIRDAVADPTLSADKKHVAQSLINASAADLLEDRAHEKIRVESCGLTFACVESRPLPSLFSESDEIRDLVLDRLMAEHQQRVDSEHNRQEDQFSAVRRAVGIATYATIGETLKAINGSYDGQSAYADSYDRRRRNAFWFSLTAILEAETKTTHMEGDIVADYAFWLGFDE